MTHASHKPDLPQIGERAFTEVLATFLSLPATPRTPSAQTPVAPPDQLAATVLLGGKGLSGTVRVLLPVPFVAQAVKQLTGLEGTEGEAVHEDAAGEIANMVAGRVAAQLAAEGYSCKLGTPSVSRMRGFPPVLHPAPDQARTELICEGHWLSLEVKCRYDVP